MVCKAPLKKIIDIIQWIVSIALMGMGIYYFFVSKNIFKGMGLLIMWGGVGINSALSIINAKYFKENFSWKNNWANITQVCMCSVFIVAELILKYLY